MNLERLTLLREKLSHTREDRFNYALLFNEPGHHYEPATDDWGVPLDRCGTTGCVAGHAILLFEEEFRKVYDGFAGSRIGCISEMLELSKEQKDFLFFAYTADAMLSDALRRLDWLLNNYDVREYDWSQESWYVE